MQKYTYYIIINREKIYYFIFNKLTNRNAAANISALCLG